MKLENIDKSIQKQDILQGISLEVSPQKLTAFIGPNGAGKSTLLSIMSRLTKKDQGILSIKGREIESWNSQELAQELTILKQKINYQAKLTVEELFWTFSLQPRSTEGRRLGKNPRNSGLSGTDQLKRPLHR